MSRVLVLSSYGVGAGVGAHYPPVQEFERELARLGTGADLVVHHARSLQAHADFLRSLSVNPALVYACGSSVMEVAARVLDERGASGVPIVYWGSHIADCGELVNPRPSSPWISGVDVPMPLYHSHRHFRLLKRLFPNLEQVHCAFSMDSAFVRGARRARYERALARERANPWIPSGAELSAFPGLGRLGELIDVAVFEHPCADPERAAQAARAIPPAARRAPDAVRACLISCIDCLHIDGAVEQMARVASESGVPFIGLNFGAFLPQHGPILSFESDLIGASRLAARMAHDLLRRARRPDRERIAAYDQFVLRLHPALAGAWGLRLSDREQAWILKSFGRTLASTHEETP
ncbi:hypothetical protein BE21_03115 [Sorangium cellulosum]|uniref:Uncharacterized protein n=1 Tax=Sorangium cellulosum TaxID=56 RepID=A0A150TPH5_SORCE|nr:hypothetical protein BE21_03115 [Sorangium cellulosum]